MCVEESLTTELNNFISTHLNSNAADIIFKYSKEELTFDLKYAAMQIDCRRKTRKKLPTFLSDINFRFPDYISSEQASNEKVAHFHAELIGKGKKVVDLSAGLGIDAFTISMVGNSVTAIELDENKAAHLLSNSKILNLTDFKIINGDCTEFIKRENNSPDYYFIDPARRDNNKRRTYSFSECHPDITKFYKELIAGGATLFIKASPLLDLSAIVKELENVRSIYVVAVKGECKEILIEVGFKSDMNIRKIGVDIINDKSVIFEVDNEVTSSTPFIDIESLTKGVYLYEPNASVMKLKVGPEICRKYHNMKKVGPNTELFISDSFHPSFPGRIIKVERVLSSRDLKEFKGKGFSVAVRNYPQTAEELRKKLKVTENPLNFIYGMRVGLENKPLIIEGIKIEV